MKLEEARSQFIQAWGTLGSTWGINRTMAQVHALLMISSKALSAEDIMEQLGISRGNVNMTVRELIDWGLVDKIHKLGERREFFWAEKDIWKITKQVAKERKKRELDPVMKLLGQLSTVEGDSKNEDVKAFREALTGIRRVAGNADKAIEIMTRAEESTFFRGALKLFK